MKSWTPYKLCILGGEVVKVWKHSTKGWAHYTKSKKYLKAIISFKLFSGITLIIYEYYLFEPLYLDVTMTFLFAYNYIVVKKFIK